MPKPLKITITAIALVLLTAYPALAVEKISHCINVNWKDELFNEKDIKPGDLYKRDVNVKNISVVGDTITVDLRADVILTEFTQDESLERQRDFLNQLEISVTRVGETDPFFGPRSFGDILVDSGSEVYFDILKGGEQKFYIFTIEFPKGVSDKNYQDRKASFDLVLVSDCLEPTPTPAPRAPGDILPAADTTSVTATWPGKILGVLTELPMTGNAIIIIPAIIAVVMVILAGLKKKRGD